MKTGIATHRGDGYFPSLTGVFGHLAELMSSSDSISEGLSLSLSFMRQRIRCEAICLRRHLDSGWNVLAEYNPIRARWLEPVDGFREYKGAGRHLDFLLPIRGETVALQVYSRIKSFHEVDLEVVTAVGQILALGLSMSFAREREERERCEHERLAEHLLDLQTESQKATQRLHELKQLHQKVSDFAIRLSHALERPLADAVQHAHHLETLRREQQPLCEESLGNLLRSVIAARAVLRELNSYSRLVEGPTEGRCRVNLATILQEARRELLKVRPEAQHLQIERDELPWVAGERLSLRLLFENLLANAAAYCDGPGRAWLTVTSSFDFYTICLRDNGLGIPSELCEEVFKPFYRLRRLNSPEGHGMGLTVCRKIVERHGGQIWIRAKDPGVAVFFTLPRVEGSREAPESQADAHRSFSG